MFEAMADISQILEAIDGGDPSAADQLLPLVYEELRKLAAQRMAREKPGHSLDATALVHEAYLRLIGNGEERRWGGRRHFFAAAAEAMRRILVEDARRKQGPKRGGRWRRTDMNLDLFAAEAEPIDIVALDDALTRLAAESAIRAEVVKLRFFGGLSVPETAEALDISVATAERYWTFARTWLYAHLSDADSHSA
jgi:RNA polymerase sigma factor (TIGR02999 family)